MITMQTERRAESELDLLQAQHDESSDPDERRAIRAAMRDIELDLVDVAQAPSHPRGTGPVPLFLCAEDEL